MDSQITLVGVTPSPEHNANTVLNFTRDSLLNATLYLRGSNRVAYVISTNSSTTCTELRRSISGSATQTVLSVCIERNELFPNKITLEGFPPTRIRTWLKAKTFSYPPLDPNAPKYVWKPTNAREIALYPVNIPFNSRPIAWFRCALQGVEPAALFLEHEAEGIESAVIASLIIVEQKYRVKNKHGSMHVPRSASLPIIPS